MERRGIRRDLGLLPRLEDDAELREVLLQLTRRRRGGPDETAALRAHAQLREPGFRPLDPHHGHARARRLRVRGIPYARTLANASAREPGR
jgi:hypothetical protein